jgi:hypothetical protein
MTTLMRYLLAKNWTLSLRHETVNLINTRESPQQISIKEHTAEESNKEVKSLVKRATEVKNCENEQSWARASPGSSSPG